MKVILQANVPGTGKKGDLINTSDGFARNYLFPKKLAIEANENNMRIYRQQEAARQAQIQAEKEAAMEIASKLKDITVKIVAKAGSNGRLFGSVTSQEIVDALSAQFGIKLLKHDLVIPEPIKAFGGYKLKVKLGHEISGVLTVSVTEA